MPLKKSKKHADHTSDKKTTSPKDKANDQTNKKADTKTPLKEAEKIMNDTVEKVSDMASEAGKAVSQAVSKESVEKTKEYASKFAFGIKANSHVILAIVSLLIGIFILRDYIIVSLEIAVGGVFLILAYLLATDFFKKDKKAG